MAAAAAREMSCSLATAQDLDLSGDSIILEVDQDLANEFNQTTNEEEEEEEETIEKEKKQKPKQTTYFNARIKESPNTARNAIHKRQAGRQAD